MTITLKWLRELDVIWKLFVFAAILIILPMTWNYGIDDGMVTLGLFTLAGAVGIGISRA
jgi:hypothetical protein